MTGVDLSIVVLIGSLATGSLAIYLLARRTGHGWAFRFSGAVAVALGIAVLNWAPNLFPMSLNRFAEPLAFGVAYFGQTLLVLWLGLKKWRIESTLRTEQQS